VLLAAWSVDAFEASSEAVLGARVYTTSRVRAALRAHSQPAAALDLPFPDITTGLEAWYCFNSASLSDCFGVAQPATKQAAGLTAKKAAKLGAAKVAALGTSSGPTPVSDRFGRPASALHFRRAFGESLRVPGSQLFPLPQKTFTVSAWLKLSGRSEKQYGVLSHNYPQMGFSLSGGNHSERLNMDRTDPSANFACNDDAVKRAKYREDKVVISGSVNASSPRSLARTPVPTNRWVHVAVTSDGCAQHFYQNGELTDISLSRFQWPADDGLGGWTIGSLGCGPHCAGFQGDLDDVRVYNRPLSVREVKSVFGACPDVCQNGGVCRHKITSFKCQCKDGWTGTTCSTPGPKQIKKKKNKLKKKKAKKCKKGERFDKKTGKCQPKQCKFGKSKKSGKCRKAKKKKSKKKKAKKKKKKKKSKKKRRRKKKKKAKKKKKDKKKNKKKKSKKKKQVKKSKKHTKKHVKKSGKRKRQRKRKQAKKHHKKTPAATATGASATGATGAAATGAASTGAVAPAAPTGATAAAATVATAAASTAAAASSTGAAAPSAPAPPAPSAPSTPSSAPAPASAPAPVASGTTTAVKPAAS